MGWHVRSYLRLCLELVLEFLRVPGVFPLEPREIAEGLGVGNLELDLLPLPFDLPLPLKTTCLKEPAETERGAV